MELFVPSYLKNTYLYQLQTTVASKKDGFIQFSDTIFHPQGGGQPNDKGWVQYQKNGELVKQQITEITSNRQSGKIFYKFLNSPNLEEGNKIKILIDKQTRIMHAKIHSSGHMIDLAVQRLKYQWQTAKGYHFTDNPYVEYKGKLEDAQKVVQQVNKQIENIIKEGIQVKRQVFSYQQAVKKGLIPQTFKTPLIRVIHFDTNNCPCGGTHIQNTNQINSLKVTKAQKKGKTIKIFYSVD